MKTDIFQQVVHEAESVILGKGSVIELLLVALLSSSHVIIEDRPGTGKSSLCKVVAHLLGLRSKRIQMTSDLLPSDILGGLVFETQTREFRFRPGPIFAELVLIDELNRASARTQSALLEAMEEGHVSVDGETYPLPQPFFVLATQNPAESHGTFELPDSARDRFLFRTSMGALSRESERSLLLESEKVTEFLANTRELLSKVNLLEQRQMAQACYVSEDVVEYALDLVEATREHYAEGLSPRASVLFLRAARSHAWLKGRDYVVPDDLKRVFPPLVSHRLAGPKQSVLERAEQDEGGAEWILENVAIRTSSRSAR